MRVTAAALAGASVLTASVLGACTSTTAGHARDGASCRPVFFGVAGSGQGVQNPPPRTVPNSVSRPDAEKYGTTIGLLKTELIALAGAQLASATAVNYPATPVSRYVGPAGLITDLAVSETKGVRTLAAAIRHAYRGGCAARPVLLAGYSQGAEVVIQAVDRLTARQQAHVTVALFGNPSYLPGEPGDFPGHTSYLGVRPALQRSAYRLPAGVRARTIDVCAPGDGVCGVDPSTSFVGRLSYVLTHVEEHAQAYAFGHHGYAARAAHFLWQHR